LDNHLTCVIIELYFSAEKGSNMVNNTNASSSNARFDLVFAPRTSALGLVSPVTLQQQLKNVGDTAKHTLLQGAQTTVIARMSEILNLVQAAQADIGVSILMLRTKIEVQDTMSIDTRVEHDKKEEKAKAIVSWKDMADVGYSLGEVERVLKYFYCQDRECHHKGILEEMQGIRNCVKKEKKCHEKNLAAYKRLIGGESNEEETEYKGVLLALEPRKTSSNTSLASTRKTKIYAAALCCLGVIDALQGFLNAPNYLPDGWFKAVLKIIVPILLGATEMLIEVSGIIVLFDLNKKLQALKSDREQETPYLNWKHGAILVCALLCSLSNNFMEEFEVVFTDVPAVRPIIEAVGGLGTLSMFLLSLYWESSLNKKITAEEESAQRAAPK
jgi:hypothetical protein